VLAPAPLRFERRLITAGDDARFANVLSTAASGKRAHVLVRREPRNWPRARPSPVRDPVSETSSLLSAQPRARRRMLQLVLRERLNLLTESDCHSIAGGNRAEGTHGDLTKHGVVNSTSSSEHRPGRQPKADLRPDRIGDILGIAMAVAAIRGVDIRPAPERTSRPAVERALALAPALLGIGAALVARLPASSRLRRWVLREALSRGFAAINCGDPWVIPVVYEPDYEIYPAAGLQTLGLAYCYRGHSGWRELIDAVEEPLPDMRYTPEHLIDLGDRWVVRLGMSGSGRTSGVRTNQTWGSVYQLSPRGRIARQDVYWRWEEALAAVGLREDC
jgi:hypothetical protein